MFESLCSTWKSIRYVVRTPLSVHRAAFVARHRSYCYPISLTLVQLRRNGPNHPFASKWAPPPVIAFLGSPEFDILDLAGPMAAFIAVGSIYPSSAYPLKVVSTFGGNIRSSCGLVICTSDSERLQSDTLVVVGGVAEYDENTSPIFYMVRQAAYSKRVASISDAVFTLALAGVLDAARVTTSWRHARNLKRLHPGVNIDLSQPCIKDGIVCVSRRDRKYRLGFHPYRRRPWRGNVACGCCSFIG